MKDEQEQLRLLLHQGAVKCDKTGRPVPCRFVVGAGRAIAVQEARSCSVQVSFNGGWPDAERTQVCFHPMDEEPVWTACWVEIRWNARFGSCTHSDLLGSLMALGTDRAWMGDLVAQEDRAYLCAMPEFAARLPAEWTSAGHTPITVTLLDEPPTICPPAGDELRDTVASLRLDSVLQSGMRVSRSRAADLIRAGAVMIDHVPEERTDRMLKPGALLSVRGFGRIRLKEVGEPTRKDRLPIVLEVFTRG